MSLSSTLRFITSHPLNQNRKLQALCRLATWQIGSRLVQGAVVIDWINGARFLVRNGETGLTGNVYAGLHEFPEMGFLLHALRPDDVFIDVGANSGSYTILACASVGARGFAFEPHPRTFARLIDNVGLNRLHDRVQCINAGLSDKPGHMRFTTHLDTMNHVLS